MWEMGQSQIPSAEEKVCVSSQNTEFLHKSGNHIARQLSLLHLLRPLSLDHVGSSFHFGETRIWSQRCQLSISRDEKMERNQNAWVRLPYSDLSVFCGHGGVTAFPGLALPICESYRTAALPRERWWTEKPDTVINLLLTSKTIHPFSLIDNVSPDEYLLLRGKSTSLLSSQMFSECGVSEIYSITETLASGPFLLHGKHDHAPELRSGDLS